MLICYLHKVTKMVLTKEQENFVKLAQVILDLLPKYLRKLFVKQWNEKFHAAPWKSNSDSGEHLWSKIPFEIKDDKELFPQDVQNKILSGKDDSWDAPLLIFLLLRAELHLIETCRRDRRLPLRTSERIANIRVIVNSLFGHVSDSQLSHAEFIKVSTELKYESLHAFGVDAVDEIDTILTSEFKAQLLVVLCDRLDREIPSSRLIAEELEAKDTDFNEKLFDLSSRENTVSDRQTCVYKLVETYVLVESSISTQTQRQPQDASLWNKNKVMELLSNEESSNAGLVPASSESIFPAIKKSKESDSKGDFSDGIGRTRDTKISRCHPHTFEALEMESELSTEDANFVRIAKILLDIIPKYLRVFFKEKWNKKYKNQQWESNISSGSLLLSKLCDEINNNKSNEAHVDQIKKGSEQNWDTKTLLFVLLHSNLSLIPRCRPENERTLPLLVSEEILTITNVRNVFFHCLPCGACPPDSFANIIKDIKHVAKTAFGETAEAEIDQVVESDIRSKKIQLNEQVQDDDTNNKQELSIEEENFLKIGKIVVNIIPKYLLICLKELWNQKHPKKKWQGNGRSGELLLEELQNFEHGVIGESVVHRLRTGSERDWDGTTLLYVLQNSGLLSADEYPSEEQGHIAMRVSKEVDEIKKINQMFYGLASCMSCSSVKFQSIIEKIKRVAKNIFGDDGENEIDQVATARIKWKIISPEAATG